MAFGESWLISVIMRFSSNGATLMNEVSSATNRANVAMDAQKAKIAAAEAQLERYRLRAIRMGTEISGAFALAGGAIVAYGLKGAGEIQRSMTSVANALAMPASGAQFDALTRTAFHVSGMTAQSASVIGQEMAVAASSGLNDPTKLTDAFERIAKAADVLWMSPKHLDPVESTKVMSQLAHLFGAYSGEPLKHMLDRAVQMMFVQPEGLQALATQGRLFISAARGHGVSEEDIFRQAMIMGQTGFLKGRGGSGLANVIEYLGGAETVTGHLSKVQHNAMAALGLTDRTGLLKAEFRGRHGEILLQKVVDHLEAMRRSTNDISGFGNLLLGAFLRQGGRYMDAALDPTVYAKSQQNWQQMKRIGTVDELWKKYSGNFLYQWNVFITNLQNIWYSVFYPLLPEFTDFFRDLGNRLGTFVDFLQSHRDVAKEIGNVAIGFTLLAGARAVAGMGYMAAMAIRIPVAVGEMTTAVNALTATLSRDAAIIRGEALVGAGAAGAAGAAAGGVGRFISFLDDVFLMGAGKWALRLGPAWMHILSRVIEAPIEALGQRLTLSALVRFGPLAGEAVGGLAAGIEALAGVASLALGPIGMLTSLLSGDAGPSNVEPNANAPAGSPANLAWIRAQAIRHAIAPGMPGNVAGNNEMNRLFPSTSGEGSMHSNAEALRKAAEALRDIHSNRAVPTSIQQYFNVTIPAGTTQQQAEEIIEHAMHGFRSAVRTSGDITTSPHTPKSLGPVLDALLPSSQ